MAGSLDRSSGAAGRPALGILRDTDFEDVVRAVNSLPIIKEREGIEVAVGWGMTELRSLLGLLDLADPRTPEAAKDIHRAIGVTLGEGFVRVMTRNDRAGFLMRRDFLAAVEFHLLRPTIRVVFNRTTADTRTPYVPLTGER